MPNQLGFNSIGATHAIVCIQNSYFFQRQVQKQFWNLLLNFPVLLFIVFAPQKITYIHILIVHFNSYIVVQYIYLCRIFRVSSKHFLFTECSSSSSGYKLMVSSTFPVPFQILWKGLRRRRKQPGEFTSLLNSLGYIACFCSQRNICKWYLILV